MNAQDASKPMVVARPLRTDLAGYREAVHLAFANAGYFYERYLDERQPERGHVWEGLIDHPEWAPTIVSQADLVSYVVDHIVQQIARSGVCPGSSHYYTIRQLQTGGWDITGWAYLPSAGKAWTGCEHEDGEVHPL